jgi:curved DNA-binding protein CbpA
MGDVETDTAAIERALRTLGLSAYTEPDEIQRAWRAKAYETHPDHGGNAAVFREVRAAAQMLLVEGTRDDYEAEARRAAFTESAASYFAPRATVLPTSPTRESAPARPRAHRRPWLLVAAIFGCLIAPHFPELGLSWDPAPFHDFRNVMQSLDWVFFAGWIWWVRKPLPG